MLPFEEALPACSGILEPMTNGRESLEVKRGLRATQAKQNRVHAWLPTRGQFARAICYRV